MLKLSAGVGAATAAACATSLLCGLVFGVYWGALEGWPPTILKFIGTSLAIGLLVAAVALVVCPWLFLIIGLPLYGLSIRLRWVSLPAYLTAGFTTSVIATLLFPDLSQFTTWFLIPGGTAASLAFWLVVRPDRSEAHR